MTTDGKKLTDILEQLELEDSQGRGNNEFLELISMQNDGN